MTTKLTIPPELRSVLNDIGRFLPMLSMVYRPSDPRVAQFITELPTMIAAVNSGDQRQLAAVAARAVPVLKDLLRDLRANPVFSDLLSILATSDLATIEGDILEVAKKA